MLAGLLIGLDLVAAAEFSFLLALPTLGAATVYEAVMSRAELFASCSIMSLVIGLVVSAVVAAIAVRAFVAWLTRHGLWPFGLYRICLAVAVLVLALRATGV